MPKKTNLFVFLTIMLGMVFLMPQSVFATDNFPGTCLEFDGSDDHVSIPSDTSLDNPQFTAEFWVKMDEPGNWEAIIDKGRDNDSDWYFLTGSTGQTEGVIFGIGNGSGRREISYSWNDSLWHHVAGTYDGSIMTLIIDGESKGSSTYSMNNTTNNICFGSRRNQSWHFEGKLDEIVIWNNARTEQEIRENMYLSFTGAETGLVSLWQLNEGSGTTAADVISGNNGTLNNMDNDDWIDSTIPFGDGASNTQIVITTGDVDFTGTGLSMFFTEKTGTDTIVTTRIDTIPNLIPTEPYDLFDQQYWIVDQYSSGTFETDLTFTFNEDLTAADESNPSRIKLYTRTSNSDGEWFFLGKAESVNVATDQATFTGITEFSQFMAGRSNITHVSGHITEDTNWQETIKVDGDIYIDDGNTLTLEPGTTVEFLGHYFIDVQGRLLAQGTETDSITFTVADTTGYYDKTHTGWNGIIFDNTPATNDTSKISYCLLEYGKRTKGGAVYSYYTRKLIFSHNSFRYNYSSGTARECGGGAIHLKYSFIQVRNNIFTHNEAESSGGAIFIGNENAEQPDTLYIIDNEICYNQANSLSHGGGGISYQLLASYVFEDLNLIHDNHIHHNITAAYGGGIGQLHNISGVTNFDANISVVGNTIEYNSAKDGGGIAGVGGQIPIEDNFIKYNMATEDGGGLYGCGTNIENNEITDNQADNDGGGLCGCYWYAVNEIIENQIINNQAGNNGGGLNGCNGDIRDNQITDNQADNNGGGLYDCDGDKIENQITDNQADNNGGGLHSCGGEMLKNLITNNQAVYDGGGLYSCETVLINNLITGNQAENGGGMVFDTNSGSSHINNTIANNEADNNGGGILVSSTSTYTTAFTNNIIYGNTADNAGNQVYLSSDNDPNFYYCNIQGSSTAFDGPGSGANYNGDYENNVDFDPYFPGSGDHPYQLTQRSVCLNNGIPDTTGYGLPDTDFMGNPRIYDNLYDIIDIGAYELLADPTREYIYEDTLSQDTFWNNGRTDTLIIATDITVNDSVTLYIEPGKHLIFAGHYFMEIQGCLSAQGAVNDSITFTVLDTTGYSANTHTGWNGIRFDDTSASNDSSKIEYCILEFSKADKGGAVYIYYFDKTVLKHCRFSNNYATEDGGALYFKYSTAKIQNCIIDYNETLFRGGGMFFDGSDAIIQDCEINSNRSESLGGGIWGDGYLDDSFSISNCELKYNYAQQGGAMYLFRTKGSLIDNEMSYNEAEEKGGALCARGTPEDECQMEGNSFHHNVSGDTGGAFYGYNTGDLSIINNTFLDNVSNGSGGGLYFDQLHWVSGFEMINNLIAYNTAGSDGGGLRCPISPYGYSQKFINNTICHNSSAGNGGGISAFAYKSDIINSIIFDNSADGSGDQIDIRDSQGGDSLYIAYCDVEGGLAGISTNGIPVIYENNIDENPLFVGTRDHPFALTVLSPCINTANPDISGLNLPEYDLAGNFRIYDGLIDIIDMGGYEYQGDVYLEPPLNVSIAVSDSVYITWDVVAGANSYKIYASDDPYTEDWGTAVDSVAVTSWTDPISEDKEFYRVVASTETTRSNTSKQVGAFRINTVNSLQKKSLSEDSLKEIIPNKIRKVQRIKKK